MGSISDGEEMVKTEVKSQAVSLTERIRARMEELGWSQVHLARETGVSRRQIIRILQGQAHPKMSTLIKILDKLDMKGEIIEQARWIEEDKGLTGLFMLVLQDAQRTGARLREFELRKGMDRASLAQASGLSMNTINNFILGSGISPANLVRLALALEVHPGDILRWSERGKEILLHLRRGSRRDDPELHKRVVALAELFLM